MEDQGLFKQSLTKQIRVCKQKVTATGLVLDYYEQCISDENIPGVIILHYEIHLGDEAKFRIFGKDRKDQSVDNLYFVKRQELVFKEDNVFIISGHHDFDLKSYERSLYDFFGENLIENFDLSKWIESIFNGDASYVLETLIQSQKQQEMLFSDLEGFQLELKEISGLVHLLNNSKNGIGIDLLKVNKSFPSCMW